MLVHSPTDLDQPCRINVGLNCIAFVVTRKPIERTSVSAIFGLKTGKDFHMGLFDRTPKSLKKLKMELFVIDASIGVQAQFPEENQRHFAQSTRADLPAVVDAAIRAGQAEGALALLNAVDQTKDYVFDDFRWLDLLSELRSTAQRAMEVGQADATS